MIFKIREEVMPAVRVCLDQNMTSEALIVESDIDTLAFDDIVKSKIMEAVERVHKTAPAYLLEEGHNLDDAVFWEDQCSGWLILPPDFMRLISFKMSDWERAVYGAISAQDPEYALQRQRVKALRGTPQKPVCAIVNRAEGKALEFYSCKSEEAYVERAQYIPYPDVDEDGGVDISERCFNAVVYTAASLVLTTLGEADKAAALLQAAQTALQ